MAVSIGIGTSGTLAASLDEAHPFSDLFGVASWDPSENAVSLIGIEGTFWVYTGNGADSRRNMETGFKRRYLLDRWRSI